MNTLKYIIFILLITANTHFVLAQNKENPQIINKKTILTDRTRSNELLDLKHLVIEQPAHLSAQLSNNTYPRLTGQRTFSVDISSIKLNQQSNLGEDEFRLELQYKIINDISSIAVSFDNILVPSIEQVSSEPLFEYIATAVLPQLDNRNSGISSSLTQQARKITAGKQVSYNWVLRDANNRRFPIGDQHNFKMPRPFTVAVMGDSFGAGEGAPDTSKTNAGNDNRQKLPAHSDDVDHLNNNSYDGEDGWDDFAEWTDRKSHRSQNSGLLKAVHKFKNDNPKVWVEFIHTAISSATISQWTEDDPDSAAGGMLGEFKGGRELFIGVDTISLDLINYMDLLSKGGLIPKNDNKQKAQLNRVEEWLINSQIGCLDTVVMSAGGNDMGFGRLIKTAIVADLNPPNQITNIGDVGNFAGWLYVNTLIDNQIADTDWFVEMLFDNLSYLAKPTQVLWANYPNLTNPDNGLRAHLQTARLGAQITGTRISASLIGSLVGFVINPFPGPEDFLLEIAAQRAASNFLREHNLNGVIFAMSLGVGKSDMIGINEIINTKLNPQITNWCEEQNSEICTLVDISDNSPVNNLSGHGLSASGLDPHNTSRYFNTFIDSYQFECGGLDCSIHPTKEGYEKIYVDETATALELNYNNILKNEDAKGGRFCSIPSKAKLRAIHNQRQLFLDTNRPILVPLEPTPPLPPPSDKELSEIANVLEQQLGGGEYGREARRAFEIYNQNVKEAQSNK